MLYLSRQSVIIYFERPCCFGSQEEIRHSLPVAVKSCNTATSLTVGAVRHTHYCIPSEFEGANLL